MNYAYLIYNLIRPEERVLDIGGASQVFRRADAVIDAVPYIRRSVDNSLLRRLPERFSAREWTVQDICDHATPFPYRDKEFDFAICAQVLEDIRDPIYVVEEMQRVARRGYIECPSRFYEQLMGLEDPGLAGANHHRWIVDLQPDPSTGRNRLVFTFKNHRLHKFKEFQLKRPKRWPRLRYPYLSPFYDSIGIYWDASFDVVENVAASLDGCTEFMQETVGLAEKLGAELWDPDRGLPVDWSAFFTVGGAASILDLKRYWGERRVRTYDRFRRRSPESFIYETELTGLAPAPADQRDLSRAAESSLARQWRRLESLARRWRKDAR